MLADATTRDTTTHEHSMSATTTPTLSLPRRWCKPRGLLWVQLPAPLHAVLVPRFAQCSVLMCVVLSQPTVMMPTVKSMMLVDPDEHNTTQAL